jgi:hypothetical protein
LKDEIEEIDDVQLPQLQDLPQQLSSITSSDESTERRNPAVKAEEEYVT